MNTIGEIFGQAATAYVLLLIAFLLVYIAFFRKDSSKRPERR